MLTGDNGSAVIVVVTWGSLSWLSAEPLCLPVGG